MGISIVYEDNHLLIVSKKAGQLVQGDITGDEPLVETLRHFIKDRDKKPGNVFLGVVHRLDRPVAGLVIFAKTSKALSRMSNLFREGKVKKTYWAIVANKPIPNEKTLTQYLLRNPKQNKSYVVESGRSGSKLASLSYKVLSSIDRYTLLEVNLHTGRHHQIRCQLSSIGCVIKGDLKYGASRSNKDGNISLLSRSVEFIHPVSQQLIHLVCPLPKNDLWHYFDLSQENR